MRELLKRLGGTLRDQEIAEKVDAIRCARGITRTAQAHESLRHQLIDKAFRYFTHLFRRLVIASSKHAFGVGFVVARCNWAMGVA